MVYPYRPCMPVIEFSASDLCKLVGKEIDSKELGETIPQIGADVEKVDGDKISVEFFPNRPDLYSVEGIARALRAFLGIAPGMRRYSVEKSDCVMSVDSSVKPIRPHIAFAMLRGVEMTDELVASLMNLQEKLHLTVGRDRAKVAIGIHDADAVQPPFTYRAADPSEGFIPLAKEDWMSLADILRIHEKGKAYAWVLEGKEKYPLIVDKNGSVLSFPPIINGALTAVAPNTKNLLVDVTGTDARAVELCLNIMVTAIADRGAKIFSVEVADGEERAIYPKLEPRVLEIDLKYARKIVGAELTEGDACNALARMGYGAAPAGSRNSESMNGKLRIEIPAYRGDVIHKIDVVEDIAIGYGYGKIGFALPEEHTFGAEQPMEKKCAVVRKALCGLGYQEAMTFVLSGKKAQFEKMRMDLGGGESGGVSGCVEVENPVTEDYAVMRVSIIPCLLELLKANKHRELPQAIFEIGDVVRCRKSDVGCWMLDVGSGKLSRKPNDVSEGMEVGQARIAGEKDVNTSNITHQTSNFRMAAGARISAKANFTEMKSDVEALLRAIGAKYSIEAREHPSFVQGRCASIFIEGKDAGFFGEISPQVVVSFELGCPVAAFELFVGSL
ncbi:MAG: phenylalanine--tRNA ligase subunit beta [Thermoplasmata archaeon HGW-Thermoplasmata-2]|nr:MAG: phenylalanine--tRNA ligase subunit beta [Thermoplasmata archaeon HGW-Thermoplasmata-2]